jgi:tetratricopeptide (TPR) repeat protein
MELKIWLLQMLESVAAEQQTFLESRTQAELASLGTLHNWSSTSPKAIISHCDMWNKKLLENCRLALQGLEPIPFSDGQRTNDLEYTEHRQHSLADVRLEAKATLDGFVQLVQATETQQLEATDLYAGQTRPLWRTLPGVILIHPVLHYVIFEATNGNSSRATETSQRLFDLSKNMGGQDTRGMAFYNLACCNAKIGQFAAAIENLSEAIELLPHLLESARKDPHLSKLHGLSAFKELSVN